MREILFRGKTYDGKWEQGDLRHKGYVHNDSDTYIMRSDYALHNIPVDPETVGQYIGLTDKNGQKIFEGDIVDILTENEEIGVITYDEGGFVVKADGFCVDFHNNINGTDLEVIGSIHDNPELLKGE